MQNSVLVVVGDFNLPHIDWLTLQGSCPSKQAFCDVVFDCNLSQLVGQPTHTTGNTLDLILTTKPAVFEALRVHSASDCPLSTDHFMLSFGLQGEASLLRHSSCTTSVVFDHSMANWEGLCNYLLDQDFSILYEYEDVELIWGAIKQVVISAMDIYTPKVRLRRHQFPKWFSPHLCHQYKCLDTLRRRCRQSPTAHNLAKKMACESDFCTQAELQKAAFESSLITKMSSGNTSIVFDYLRNLKEGGSIPPTVHLNGERAWSDSAKAMLFNKCFHSVYTSSSHCLPVKCNLAESSFAAISVTEVYEELIALDTTKAKDIDGIGPILLKHCALALYQPLCHLFVRSVKQHRIPSEWKIHVITPIHKSGDRQVVANYKPISLLSCTSKVLERIISVRLCSVLQDSCSQVQFGFQSGHSAL